MERPSSSPSNHMHTLCHIIRIIIDNRRTSGCRHANSTNRHHQQQLSPEARIFGEVANTRPLEHRLGANLFISFTSSSRPNRARAQSRQAATNGRRKSKNARANRRGRRRTSARKSAISAVRESTEDPPRAHASDDDDPAGRRSFPF